MYSRFVQRAPGRSPTPALIFGLVITLAAVVAYSWYITIQIAGLRNLQNNLTDRSRRDSLQLLRIQNDLNSLAVAMRDMLDNDEPYPLTAWSAQFQRIRSDLDDALRLEEQLAVTSRTQEQKEYLASSLAQFWDAAERIFALASDGKDKDARDRIRLSLQARQAALSTAVARLLVQNNEREEQAALQVAQIYDRVERQVYLFFTATLVAILLTSLYLIRSNRRLFTQLASLSNLRSELAQQLISTQESTLRYISRELHDEFGQILTAIGSMLGRSEKHVPEGSPLRAELHEIRDIAQTTLDNVRSLSQALHPVMLDEAGLESTIDWYLPVVEKQTGIVISYEKSGAAFPMNGSAAIYTYRILQEALNNVARHAGVQQAWIRLRFLPDTLEMEVEDHGKGFAAPPSKPGIGLVAMRERAQLLGGSIELLRPPDGGTLVRLKVPREKAESNAREEPQ
ncbi:MAG: two-component sensor histidine kinase [Acidobacteria bacterium 13_1_20CM_2_60_10]|nr:MAG: two-component sensor histidine kinase [Acidobacteria bacterium 13_1_20CM_2_60_10]